MFNNTHNSSKLDKIKNSRFLHPFDKNLGAERVGGILIGSNELPEKLNAAQYLQFLDNDLGPLLDEVPLDGAPAHYAQKPSGTF